MSPFHLIELAQRAQTVEELVSLAKEEKMYAYDFEGRRYDVGDRLGFLEATVEYALRREDLAAPFKTYLKNILN